MKKITFTIVSIFLFLFVLSAKGEWIKVNHPESSKIYVFGWINGILFTCDSDNLIYQTTNFGKEWKSFTVFPPYLYGLEVTRNGNIVKDKSYAGISLDVSTNGGETFFDVVYIEWGDYEQWLSKLNSRYIFFKATIEGANNIYISKDGINYFRFCNSIDPKAIQKFIVFNDKIAICKIRDTLFRTEDFGYTYNKINPGFKDFGLYDVNSKGKVFMFINDTLFTSIDSGWTWQKHGLTNPTQIQSLVIDNYDNIYIIADEKIFCSYDDGINWVDITENLYASKHMCFSDTKIFVRGAYGGIYYRDIKTDVSENPINNSCYAKTLITLVKK